MSNDVFWPSARAFSLIKQIRLHLSIGLVLQSAVGGSSASAQLENERVRGVIMVDNCIDKSSSKHKLQRSRNSDKAACFSEKRLRRTNSERCKSSGLSSTLHAYLLEA